MRKIVFKLMMTFACFCLTQAVSAQLPAVTLKTMDGQAIKTDTLSNNGKPFIIDFADWQEETGVKIFAVSIDQAQNIQKVKPLVNNHGWEYDVLLDPNSDFRKALGAQMIPFVVVCDGKGNIVYRHNGYTDGAEEELINKVRELVK